ncbi:WD repeat-containing protein 91 [Lingula anatina]|uniref:WD repeat-containing protein 91 n=1 Tax=Lingula anatina TaxID=7574 RepID=A0A1S3HCL6_LINAN|nr:WD repeat-containing protein 91 [Lingula anatina]|eukprot:XP_013383261.1 WD repeat-containing protein 91 [Lingula anatina]
MAATGQLDDLVKDYLLFRGLTSTLRAFENELKNEKDKGFRVDKIIEQFQLYVAGYELAQLREYWAYLDRRLFSRLDQVYASSIRKLEVSMLKYYLINAVQNNRMDRVSEFFERLSSELQNQVEWKDWFVLPFIKNPEENPSFSMYFTKIWLDTFLLSLHNFLNVIFQSMPLPPLLSFKEEQAKLAQLQDENNMYSEQLTALMEKKQLEEHLKRKSADRGVIRTSRQDAIQGSMELMDEFYTGTQDTVTEEPKRSSHPKLQIKPLFHNIRKSLPNTLGHLQGKDDNPISKAKAKEIKTKSKAQNSPPRRMKLQEEHEKQRQELLGKSQPNKEKITTDGSAQYYRSSKEPEGQFRQGSSSDSNSSANQRMQERINIPTSFVQKESSQPVKRIPSDPLLSSAISNTKSPFMLLSQDNYTEHRSSIIHCRFSNTGHCIASADVDGIVKVWSLQPSPVTVATIISKSGVMSLEWASPTDKLLLFGNKSGCVRLYDIKDKKTTCETMVDEVHPRVVSLSYSAVQCKFVCSSVSRGRYSSEGQADNSVQRMGKVALWDMKTMKLEKDLPMIPGPVAVNCTTYNHNGNLLITGAVDGMIRIFDMRSYDCIAAWGAHLGEVYSVQFSNDENSFYCMGSDGKFLQWSVHKMSTKIQDLPLHPGATGPFTVTGPGGYQQTQKPKGKLFAFDSDGKYVLTCADTGGKIYKVDNGMTDTMYLSGHKSPVVTVDWSSATDTKMCLTGSMDGSVRVSALLSA